MPFVEQTILIRAPLDTVRYALNNVEAIPQWATLSGTIDNVRGSGVGMTYQWSYNINHLAFSGKSEVIEQTETSLITKTSGDIESIWSIYLTYINKNSTSIQVLVEYTPPNTFIEILADMVLEQISNPDVAKENIIRFKNWVEEQVTEEQAIAGAL